MIIQMDTGEGYVALFNLMHELYVPCREEVADAGREYEKRKKRFYDYAKNEHDSEDVVSAEVYTVLMTAMDDAHKQLIPYKDEWWRSRHGYGLN